MRNLSSTRFFLVYLIFLLNQLHVLGQPIVLFQADISNAKALWGKENGYHMANTYLQCQSGHDCRDWIGELAPEVVRFPTGSNAIFTHLVRPDGLGGWECTDGWGYSYEEIEDFLIQQYLTSYSVSTLEELTDLYPCIYNPDDPESDLMGKLNSFRLEVSKQYDDDGPPIIECADADGLSPRPNYFCEFMNHINSMEDTYGQSIDVIYLANITTASPMENVATIQMMLDNGLNVVGVEMGNEMFFHAATNSGMLFKGDEDDFNDCGGTEGDDDDITDDTQGANAAQAYYDYVNGKYNANTAYWLYTFRDFSHSPNEDEVDYNIATGVECTANFNDPNVYDPTPFLYYSTCDYIKAIRAADNPVIRNIAIGLCGATPAVSNYTNAMGDPIDVIDEGRFDLFGGWNTQLGSFWNLSRDFGEGIGVKKDFDAYIVHPYFISSPFYENAISEFLIDDLNTWESPFYLYNGFVTGVSDTRLIDAFNVGRNEFMNFINDGFTKYWNYYMSTYHLNLYANPKDLWFTEWNILGANNQFGNPVYDNFDTDDGFTTFYNTEIFYNTFLEASMDFNWYHLMNSKALALGFSGAIIRGAGSRIRYATLHSIENEKPIGPISQKRNLDISDVSDDANANYKFNQRKRITYNTFSLVKEINLKDLRWTPVSITGGLTASQLKTFHIYGYLNEDKSLLYVYFDNLSDNSRILNLNPALTGGYVVNASAPKTLTYFTTNKMYSGYGYSPLLGHNESYDDELAVFSPVNYQSLTEIPPFTASTYIIPHYSQGFFTIPISCCAKTISELKSENLCDNFNYVNELNKLESYLSTETKNELLDLFVYNIQGELIFDHQMSSEFPSVELPNIGNGVYIYVIHSSEEVCGDKFVITK